MRVRKGARRYPTEYKRLEEGSFGDFNGGGVGKSKRKRRENQSIHPFPGTMTQSESMITYLKKKNTNILCHSAFVRFCYSSEVTESHPEYLSKQ